MLSREQLLRIVCKTLRAGGCLKYPNFDARAPHPSKVSSVYLTAPPDHPAEYNEWESGYFERVLFDGVIILIPDYIIDGRVCID